MRTFDGHEKRRRICLDGAWKFRTEGETAFRRTFVPSCWNNELGLLSYEGVCIYERTFYCEGGTIRLCFAGVTTEAEVFFDGERLGEHYGGFCEFSFIKRGVPAGEHTLTVRVDNSFDENSIPQARVDWWHYGGITRSVFVEILEGLCVTYARTEYELKDARASVTEKIEVYNAAEETVEDSVNFTLGAISAQTKIRLAAGEIREIELTGVIMNPRLWDLDDAYLYQGSVETSTDGLLVRTGFRTVEVKRDGVYLNGKRRELRGVNRHEEHPEWGTAFPTGLMKRDLDILTAAGVNAVRGSHYPQSHAFIDLCDEAGVLFWSEIPVWGCGFSVETLGNPVVLERGLQMHREMVRYYYDHPSIIIWGMHNEIRSESEEGQAMSKAYYEYLKANGGNRLVTYASNRPFDDKSFAYCDLICINHYSGWYGSSIDGWVDDIRRMHEYIESCGQSDKPVVISEFGAAALYGFRDVESTRWTEEYQAELLGKCLELFHADPQICGSFVWQFADIRSDMDINRARSFNNKGIVNEYRKPKLAYFKVKEKYLAFKAEE